MNIRNDQVECYVSLGFFRKLTPKECFLFQGYPEDFKLPSDMALSHLYKQAGNSVVVPVIKRLATEMYNALQKTDTV